MTTGEDWMDAHVVASECALWLGREGDHQRQILIAADGMSHTEAVAVTQRIEQCWNAMRGVENPRAMRTAFVAQATKQTRILRASPMAQMSA